MNVIPPRSGVALTMAAGEVLDVIDIEGGQVCDLLAFAASDVREVISNGRTFDYEESIRLTTGNKLWSNRSRPLLTIVHDDAGCHDFLLTACSEATFRHFYPDQPVHRGCFGNLAEALAPYGVEPDSIPCAFNVFMNVPVDHESGRISVKPPLSRAGDMVSLVAEVDLVVGLTACSAYASNGGMFKPIGWNVRNAGTGSR